MEMHASPSTETRRSRPRTATAEPMPEVEAAFEEIEVDAPAGRDHHGLEERQAEDAAGRRRRCRRPGSATRSA